MSATPPPDQADRIVRGRSPYTRRRRPGFGLRLTVTLLVTTAVIGLAQYLLAAHALTNRVVEQTTAGYRSDGRVLEGLYNEATGDRWAPVRELLGHIASRPGSREVAVVGPDARVVAVGARHRPNGAMKMDGGKPAHGTGHQAGHGASPGGAVLPHGRRAIVDAVLAGGDSFGGQDPRSTDHDGLYAVPLELAGRRHALVVVSEPGALARQLADIRWILLATLVLGVPLGLPLFFLVGGRSLTARHSKAINQSSRDALSGVGNHRAFHEEMRRMVAVAQRRDHRLALLLVDLDHFKQVNDTHGHRRGDALLAQFGGVLLSGRTGDVPFRVGGDEFAVLLPDTDAAEAAVVAERIRARVEAEIPGVTASAGVAQLGVPAPDAETLLASADVALYDAKRAGRNRVATFLPLERTSAGDPVA